MGLNCDFPGNDIQIIDYISKQSCISLCKKNKECTHFVWNPHLRNKCFIKKRKYIISTHILNECFLTFNDINFFFYEFENG